MFLALLVSLAIGLVLTAGCGTPARVLVEVTPQEAYALIQDNRNNPDFVILDVRTPEEFAETHIEAAVNLDFYAESFRDELDRRDKSKTYLIYCRSDNRSGEALKIMGELGFREVYDMSGGIIAWEAEGRPIVK